MILLTYGTRPEWIKIKPLIEEMEKENIPFKILFTGQHKTISNGRFDYSLTFIDYGKNRLDNIIMNCMNIPEEFFDGITHILVQGDTTSVTGLALSALHRQIPLIHLEAGLRTYDNENPYPEENNRKIVSTIAKIHLCPTESNRKNLENENVSGDIYVVGNTGLDNIISYREKCTYSDTVLVTLHRRENHDKINLWFEEINNLAIKYPEIKFILPIHPNPKVQEYKELLTNVVVCDPLLHDELMEILINVKLVITDSGGLQEECSFLNKKCLICRETTERPESLGLSGFIIESPEQLEEMFDKHINSFRIDIKSPYGDGHSSEKICEIFKNLINMDKITATMATFKARIESLKDSVDSIINQVDELWVYINDYTNVPSFLINDKIKVFIGAKCDGDIKAKGKFYNSDKIVGYHCTIDDDLIYPKDYIKTYINKINQYGNKVIITALGKITKPNSKNYYNDNLFSYHYQRLVLSDYSVHLGGTGVMMYHTDYFKPNYDEILSGSYVDLFIGMQAQKQKIPTIVLKHGFNWIISNPKDMKNLKVSLFNSGNLNYKKQTEIMNSVKWELLKPESMSSDYSLTSKEEVRSDKKKRPGGTSNGNKNTTPTPEPKIQEQPIPPTRPIINTPIAIQKPNVQKPEPPKNMQTPKAMNKTHGDLFMGKSMKKNLRFGKR